MTKNWQMQGEKNWQMQGQQRPTKLQREEARKLTMEKAKALQEKRRKLEAEQKTQEEAAAVQETQTKEKEIIDLSSAIEHLKKIERENHIEEQRAAQLAREKIKEALRRKAEGPILEPREGSPKKPRQEDDEELENIQADPIPSTPKSIPPSSPKTHVPPPSSRTPPSPKSLQVPKSPPAPASPQQQQHTVEPPLVPPSSQDKQDDQPMDKTDQILSILHVSTFAANKTQRDRGPDLKIACPIFKGKRHDDPDVHIQAFEQYAELKHILEEEWGEYFPHTMKEAAKKWYYHYLASKLRSYRKLKKAFVLEYTDDRGDEDILCELDRINRGNLSVREYVQKIKELTRRLNEPPSEKRMRAWFLRGFNSKKLREQKVQAPTNKFIELVHNGALKLEQQAKKEKHRHKASTFDSNSSDSSKAKKTGTSTSDTEEDKKKKKNDKFPNDSPAQSKLNPQAKEWNQQTSTWKEKGKAKEYDEWKEQRELAATITKKLEKKKPELHECFESRATITEKLEKKKPKLHECFEARAIHRIPIAEALLLDTQNTGTPIITMDSSKNNCSSGNEQDEIEVKMCQRIENLTIKLEYLRQSLPALAQFIKNKKQAEAMKVDTPQIKDDEVPVIQLHYKNRKMWEPLSRVMLDGGARVNIIGEHMKEKMGITNIKPAPFRVRMADQRIVQPNGLLEHMNIKVGS
ncbi:hypothetical protein L7F22_056435 [Adiantum nelumboides]|nr:hypothetical protein [Adiantum nelumboides]